MTNRFLNWIFLLIISISIALINTYFSIVKLDINKEFEKSLQNTQNQFIFLKKKTHNINQSIPISEEEINEVKQNINTTVQKCYSATMLDDYSSSIISSNVNVPDIEKLSYYYLEAAYAYKSFDLIEINPDANSYKNILIGRLPANKNEVMISSLLADYIIKFKEDNLQSNTSDFYKNIIENNFEIKITNTKHAKVVGIIKYDTSKYENLKSEYPTEESLTGENVYTPNKDKNISGLYQEFVTSTFGYNNIYVHSDFIDSLAKNKKDYITSLQIHTESKEQVLNLSKQYKLSENGLYIYSDFSKSIFESLSNLKNISKIFLSSGLTLIILTLIIGLLVIKNKIFFKKEVIILCISITVFSLMFAKFTNKIFLNNPLFLVPQISLSSVIILSVIEISIILCFSFKEKSAQSCKRLH